MARKAKPPNTANESGKDYDVGYRRPPKASRWTAGQSGNPSGRPRKKKTLNDHILDVLDQTIVVEARDGRRRRVKRGRIVAEQLVGLSVKGVAGAVRPVAAADAKRERPKAPETDRLFDSEAPLSEEELEIARVAMEYALRGSEELFESIAHHAAEAETDDEGES